MATSEEKTASNRRNAQKSTGPKTVEGKESIKHNAVKYGIYAQDALIHRGDGKEDAGELDELTQEFFETFEPVGPMERSLVTTLVTTLWRERRIHRAEIGGARLRLDSFAQDQEWSEEDRVSNAIAALDGTVDPDPYPVPGSHRASVISHRNTLLRSTKGVGYLIDLLRHARRGIEQSGAIDVGTSSTIQSIFEDRAEELCRALALSDEEYGSDASGELGDESEEDTAPLVLAETLEPERWRRLVLRLLQRELRNLGKDLRALQEREELRGEAWRALFAIPKRKMAEQLQRTERGLENQRYRALQELGRLQQQRRDRES